MLVKFAAASRRFVAGGVSTAITLEVETSLAIKVANTGMSLAAA
jgi:hypothetical protein